MDKITTQDVWLRETDTEKSDNENFAMCFFENNEWGHLLDLVFKQNMVVLTKADFDKVIKEVAWEAWKSAANAFRMYPDNKHTFADYWDGKSSLK